VARILVIDDQPLVLDVLRRMLEDGGHQVGTARDGEEGLKLFAEKPADVVVCDLFMPGVNGLEVIHKLRQLRPGVPVVAVSGGSFNRERDLLPDVRATGAAAFLPKPFTPAALLAAVAEVLQDTP
jgi:CheY-like chemotaxis protein